VPSRATATHLRLPLLPTYLRTFAHASICLSFFRISPAPSRSFVYRAGHLRPLFESAEYFQRLVQDFLYYADTGWTATYNNSCPKLFSSLMIAPPCDGPFECCSKADTEFRIREAIDGLDAIEKAKSLRPNLILQDLAMPHLNGVKAATVLKNAMPGTHQSSYLRCMPTGSLKLYAMPSVWFAFPRRTVFRGC
jgi:CheY-like chemotaxis protein